LICDGGGATTVGGGSVSFAVVEVSRCGDDTGGATTLVVCVIDERELAKSRWASLGAGAITDGAIEFALRNWSRFTSGAGAITGLFTVGSERWSVLETSGVGAIAFAVRLFGLRVRAEFNSGVGGTTVGTGKAGAARVDRSPSAGGGPGIDLNASRFATDESDRGRFSFGASTTFSVGAAPRATRIVCVRWCASLPPARPDLPAVAPPVSSVRGNSSPV
jgi:hypothetical protein